MFFFSSTVLLLYFPYASTIGSTLHSTYFPVVYSSSISTNILPDMNAWYWKKHKNSCHNCHITLYKLLRRISLLPAKCNGRLKAKVCNKPSHSILIKNPMKVVGKWLPKISRWCLVLVQVITSVGPTLIDSLLIAFWQHAGDCFPKIVLWCLSSID